MFVSKVNTKIALDGINLLVLFTTKVLIRVQLYLTQLTSRNKSSVYWYSLVTRCLLRSVVAWPVKRLWHSVQRYVTFTQACAHIRRMLYWKPWLSGVLFEQRRVSPPPPPPRPPVCWLGPFPGISLHTRLESGLSVTGAIVGLSERGAGGWVLVWYPCGCSPALGCDCGCTPASPWAPNLHQRRGC